MDDRPQRLYDVVVIGASAGGIEALSVLVTTLPRGLLVPIVVAQHLDPNVPSHLGQILERRSTLPVRSVREDAPEHLEDGTIYVVPADRDVEITDHSVRLRPGGARHPTPSIDRLFASAARVYGERVIAVILSGSGSDGTVGARGVKAAGGTVLIENPATASYPAMPASLPPTTVDLVVDLERIGSVIADLISGAPIETGAAAPDTLAALLEQVRGHTGIDFSKYKRPTILRRMQRRMTATGAASLHDYNRFMEEHPEEYQHLVSSFLINVTEFFRDQEFFTYLRERILPEILARARTQGNELRIWSAGCSTGEEAYTIAILLAEALGPEALQFNVRIFATDVDADAIVYARRGHYTAASLAAVPAPLRARYFTPSESGFEIAKSIRNMVIFGEHDLAQRAPFPRMDLVVCRNVLIYFTPELQVHALRLFAFAVRTGGFLVLGSAESAGALGTYFAQVDPHFKVYRRQGEHILVPPLPPGGGGVGETESLLTEAALSGPPQLRLLPAAAGALQAPPPVYAGRAMRGTGQRVYTTRERLADQILGLPLGVVVVDRNYDVLTINSAAYALLDVHRPAMGRDILHLAERVPTKPLRAAIDEAFQATPIPTASTGAVTVTVELEPSLELREQESRTFLQITCYPDRGTRITAEGGTSPTVEAVVLLISEAPQVSAAAGEGAPKPGEEAPTQGGLPEVARDEALARLQQELTAERNLTRELRTANQELRSDNDRLLRANEDLFVAQEELQASSEEVKALNEEMQATNEELETLNEELEATVEELHTTNDDLTARAQQLQNLAQEKDQQHQTAERERAQLAAMLLGLRDAVLAVDATGKTILTNDTYHRTFDDVEAQVRQGQLVIEDELGHMLALEAAPWRRAGEQAPFALAFSLCTPDGTRQWFEAAGQPVIVDGHLLGGVVTIHDLTDRGLRSLYERFLAQVSHELANPLAALVITLQMLARQLPAAAETAADERMRTLVMSAQRHVQQLRILVGDLGDLERVQHDKLQLSLQPVDLAALVRRVVEDTELIRPAGQPSPPIAVQVELETAQFWVSGDAARIEQILRNVLTNALRYASESERIDVRLRRVHERGAAAMAELEVQDYGPGIPAADQPFLFTPFFQGSRNVADRRGGLGLGLYIVQQLVQAHGGRIEVRSPEGRGTTVVMRFPLLTEAPEAATPDEETAPARKPAASPEENKRD